MARGRPKSARVSTALHWMMRRFYRVWTGPHRARNGSYVFGVSEATFYQHVRRDADEPWEDHATSQPKLLPEHQLEFAEMMETYGPVLTEELPAIIFAHCSVDVSTHTAENYLKAAGLQLYAAQSRPTIRQEDHRARRAAAGTIQRLLGEILFLDECTVGKTHTLSPHYWGHHSGEHWHVPLPASLRSNVVGAMCLQGVLPLQFPAAATLTGNRFAACLDTMLADPRVAAWGIQFIVMDNARIHNVDAVKNVLLNHGITRIQVPPYSPDLNPIEHLWGHLKTAVNKIHYRKALQTIDELDIATTGVWQLIEVSATCENFAHTLSDIIAAQGAYTGG